MPRICVFCGSSPGAGTAYVRAARELGRLLVQHGLGLVYGGGRVGLMYEIAREVHQRGGEVIGVIPRTLLERELGYAELLDLRVVGSMHERKALMAELADAFIALPGGLGTIEETFEVLTWTQLGIHHKPCGLLNVRGYYDRLLAFVDHAVSEGFIAAGHRSLILLEEDPEALLYKLEGYRPATVDKARWAVELG
jgi:uncharacterized protein (TIGR00730 family)